MAHTTSVKLHTHRNDQVNINVSPIKYVQKGPNQDRFEKKLCTSVTVIY